MYIKLGGALKGDFPGYVPRPADTDLVRSMLQGALCYILTARQTGKSSLKVRAITELNQMGWTCVDIDLTTFGTKNIEQEQWYFTFLNEIAMSLDMEDQFEDWWLSKNQFTAVARFSMFWGEFLLPNTEGTIGIFIDEIDSMLTLRNEGFSTDDFFAALRAVYNAQSVKEELDRIRFCIIGVALAEDLMEDPARTPFNIGKAINLDNFLLEDAGPLAAGLGGFEVPAENLLASIMSWSWGQPYLTQTLCEEIRRQPQIANAQAVVDQAVQGLFLQPNNLSSEDNLANVDRRVRAAGTYQAAMLSCYSKILSNGMVPLDLRRPEQVHLKLTGLVKEEAGGLVVNNRIYREVFNQEWVDRVWYDMERPFALELRSWIRNNRSEDYLLRGNALGQAINWAQDHESISRDERDFIEESRAAADKRKDEERRYLLVAIIALGIMMLATASLSVYSIFQTNEANEQRKIAEEEKWVSDSLRQSDRENLELLEKANYALDLLRIDLEKSLDTTKNAKERAEIGRRIAELQRLRAGLLADSMSDLRTALIISNAVEKIGSTNPALSMRLAEYAYELDPSPLIGATLMNSYKKGMQGLYSVANLGVKGNMTTFALSASGKYIVTGSNDNTVRLWNPFTSEEIIRLGTHKASVLAVAIHPNEQLVLTGCADNIARLIDIKTGKEIRKFEGHVGNVTDVAFHPVNNHILTASSDLTIKLWDFETGDLLRTYVGHSDEVNVIEIKSDGKQFLSGSIDTTARLWDFDNPNPIQEFRGHSKSITSLYFHHEKEQIFTGSEDGTVRIWNVSSAQEVGKLIHTERITAVTMDPNNKWILTGSNRGIISYWDPESRKLQNSVSAHQGEIFLIDFLNNGLTTVTGAQDNTVSFWDRRGRLSKRTFSGYTGTILSAAFHPSGKYIMTTSSDHIVRLWDLETGREIQRFIGHTDDVLSVAIDPLGRFALTGSLDRTLRIWDIKTGNQYILYTVNPKGMIQSEGAIRAVAIDPTGRYALIGNDADIVSLIDLKTLQIAQTFEGHEKDIFSVAFHPTKPWVLTGARDGVVKLWDIKTGDEIRTFTGHEKGITALAFSPDGNLFVSGSRDYSAKLWNTNREEQMYTFTEHSDQVISVAFHPEGQLVMTGSKDSKAKVWEVATGKRVQEFDGHKDGVLSVAFNPVPDGEHQVLTASSDHLARAWRLIPGTQLSSFATTQYSFLCMEFLVNERQILTGQRKKEIFLWDLTTEEVIRTFKGHKSWVLCMDYHPDKKQFLTGSRDSTAILWDFKSGNSLQVLRGHSGSVWCAALHPTKPIAITGSSDNTIRMWDLKSGKEIENFGGHRNDIRTVEISPDGRLAASGSADNTIKIWDLEQKREIQNLEGHEKDVNVVKFTKDGSQLLSGSEDGTARLWDIETGEELTRFEGHKRGVLSVAIHPSGKQVVTGSEDRTVRIWDLSGVEVQLFEKHYGSVFDLSFHQNSGLMYSAARDPDRSVRLWTCVKPIDDIILSIGKLEELPELLEDLSEEELKELQLEDFAKTYK